MDSTTFATMSKKLITSSAALAELSKFGYAISDKEICKINALVVFNHMQDVQNKVDSESLIALKNKLS